MTNPTISGPTISAEIETQTGKSATSKTVSNIIHRHGLKGYFAVKKPFISKKNRLKRLKFARLHVNKPDSFWRTILWSDEPKYNIFGSDRHRRVWRKPKEALKTKNLNPTVKHGGGSLLIWGCMSYNGLGNLEFIDGIMTKEVYLGILQRNIKSSASKLGLRRQFIFQDDNDPKHKAKLVQEFLKNMKINRLEWPAQSPDLNRIEHLWDVVEREIRKFPISNKNQLKTRITEAWGIISENVTNNLVDSMPRRCQAVIAAKGGPTKY